MRVCMRGTAPRTRRLCQRWRACLPLEVQRMLHINSLPMVAAPVLQ